MCLNCQPPPPPLLTDKPRQRAGGSYVQSRVMLRGSVRTGGWGEGGRRGSLVCWIGHVYASRLRKPRVPWPSPAGKRMLLCALFSVPSLLLFPLGARRPYPTPPARRPAVTPPRPSAVVPHQPLVAKWLDLCPQDAGSSIPRLCQWPEEMCSYP